VFMGDRMRQDAIIRKLEIIGEAVNSFPIQRGNVDRRFLGRGLPA
jgi:uncharacterized protein with HEPN domain